MDGNRRWAIKQGLETLRGHHKGAETVKSIAEFCIKNSISFLSLYTFSIENFKRSETEKSFLFNLFFNELEKNRDEFIKKSIRVRFIGNRSLFPKQILSLYEQIEEETAQCTTLNLNFLFCYGAQQEIVHATQEIASQVKAGLINIDEITPELFSRHLWTRGMPDPDIVIRTGGQHRLSNFLLFQSAYSEYFFLDCLWPDMTPQILEQVFHDFQNRKRNFGK